MRNPRIHNGKQSGQAIVLIAIIMVALIASLGLAIDGGGMYLLYRDVQNATDSAGLSAAFALCSGGDYEEAAEVALALNGFVEGADGVDINIVSPPPAGTTYANNDDYVYIEIIAPKPSYFIQIVYGGPLQVVGATTSHCDPGSDFGWPRNSAIITLAVECAASSGNRQTASGRAQGNGNLTTVGGGYYGNADDDCSKGTIDTGGNGTLRIGGYGVCARGSVSGNVIATEQGGTITERSDCGVDQIPADFDPYVSAGLETPDTLGLCGSPQTLGNSNVPGTYASFEPRGTHYLAPGIYCITDDTIDWKGHVYNIASEGGVFLYFDGTDDIKATGNSASMDLYAITDEDSPYTNLLMWFDDRSGNISNADAISLTAQSSGDLVGTIYAPRKHCDLSGEGSIEIHAQIICYSFDYTGNGSMVSYFGESLTYQVPANFGIAE